MRDRARRRNYSAEAEEFRREHARHREWGLTQRHARKLSRLYGSTANAAAAFQRRVDELTSASCSVRAVTPTSSEPVGPEPPASAPAVAEPVGPVGPKAITSEQAEPVQVEPEQAEPEQAEPEQAEPEQAEPEQIKPVQAKPEQAKPQLAEPVQAEPEQAEPVQAKPQLAEPEQAKPEQAKPEGVESEGVAGAARVSGPRGPGNGSRCPDRRFCSRRPGRRGPGRPGRPPGSAWKGPRRPESLRHIRPRTDPESPQSQARRPAGTTGVMNARRRRRTPVSPRPNRTTSPILRNCRDHIPP